MPHLSAIVGTFERNRRPVHAAEISAAVDVLAASGYGWGSPSTYSDFVALAQTCRSGTDPVRLVRAPYQNGSLVVVADARLDDRDQLLHRLEVPPPDRAHLDDCALIARAYRRWGRDCPDEILGDFAFAIWDLEAQALFCARDPIGARPLYLHHTADRFVFASDPHAVVACGVPDDIDEEAVARYLHDPIAVDPRRTLFGRIEKLPPGRSVWVTADAFEERTYWTPFEGPEISLPSPPDYADRLRQLVRTSVEDRLPRSGAAVHLSGGLDSSAIAALAAQTARARGDAPPLAFAWSPPVSTAFPYSAQDERKRIEEVAAHEGLEHLYPLVSASDYRDFLSRDLRSTANGLVIEWAALPQVADRGVQTVLSGWGGDEAATFDARGLLPDLLARGRLLSVARGLRDRFGRHPAKWLPAVRDRVLMPLIPDAWLRRPFEAAQRQRPPSLAHPELAGGADAFREPPMRERRGSRAMQRMLLENGHLAERMEAWTHWGAAHGVRYAYPLTDRRVLEFIYRSPVDLHTSGPYTRHLFRAAMEDVLPDALRWRRSKYDQATERQRTQLRLGLWTQLRSEAEVGQWDARDCPWIDMPRLRDAMRAVPERIDTHSLHQFIRIASAVEVVHLWERVQRGSSPSR